MDDHNKCETLSKSALELAFVWKLFFIHVAQALSYVMGREVLDELKIGFCCRDCIVHIMNADVPICNDNARDTK